ncbi:MAG: hypothetical protein HN704_07320 [Bacteroidetes bacterium]|jgi:hypothetical protein|nr:hypothetical protein [Bacteroidota bacterium]MBT6687640.1 hypothetical protein [Bacteroidota bacterium]MBT7144771.1 hypothetical protein [Bacteroidota bacterium]MBT7491398.1 hypothetical protein [Bacteroidota bacterium]
MKISGFTMVKNAEKLYYPIKQSIQSILPIVDEFVIALGNCDPDDNTRLEIESIGNEKIKIIDTVWDLEKYPRGMENAHQTDIAKSNCSGDWLFYLQADEVVHEKYLETIKTQCQKFLNNHEIEGLIFKYKHFWGDYNHYHNAHGWYRNEIRIVRNSKDIHSWESAQSFRRMPDFDMINYRQQKNTFRLKVAHADAEIYHYGWVRPPKLMKAKTKSLATIHKGESKVQEMNNRKYFDFDYGPLNYLPVFKETHPEVMAEWIKKFDWENELQHSGKPNKNRKPNKHEILKYRILTFIEQKILFGKSLGEFKNYILLKN